MFTTSVHILNACYFHEESSNNALQNVSHLKDLVCCRVGIYAAATQSYIEVSDDASHEWAYVVGNDLSVLATLFMETTCDLSFLMLRVLIKDLLVSVAPGLL